MEKGREGVCRRRREGDRGIGGVSEEECMMEVMEGEGECGGQVRWEGRWCARGWEGGRVDRVKEGVQEDSIVTGGKERGGEMGEDGKGIV